MTKLCDVCDFQGGSQPPKNEWSLDKRSNYVRMLQIRDFTQSEKTIPEYVKITNSIKECTADDILIARYGASLGKILTGLSGAYNVAIMKAIPDTNVLRKKYLYYFLRSDYFQKFIINVGSRAAQAGFNKEDLSRLNIPCPELKKQDEIVQHLLLIEKIIKARANQLILLDVCVKSRFVEMFGDPVLNERKWRTNTLKNKTTKIGSGATPRGGKGSYKNKGISLIRSMNVYDGRFEYKDLAHLNNEQAKQLDNVEVLVNDVLFNITGASIARTCIVPIDVLPARVNQHVSIIRCNNELDPIFVNMQFLHKSFKNILLGIGERGGATRQAITKQQLENLMIIVPPLGLQTQFAEFVQQVDKLKAVVQKSLDETQMLFDALMQEYFG